jgi:Protein phosphatase 2C
MNADSAFNIGSTHAVCQDYAVAANRSDTSIAAAAPVAAPYVVVSDGCSTSGSTDVGARLLVKAAEQILRQGGRHPVSPEELHVAAAQQALHWAELIGLPPQAIDATLLTAYLDGDDLIVACSGDGVMVLQSRTGTLDVFVVSYPAGFPLYPGYLHQPERLRTLEAAGGVKKEVKHLRRAALREPLLLKSITHGSAVTEVIRVAVHDCLFAALLSDGVHSFSVCEQTGTGKRVEPVPLAAVLKDLVSFKSVGGSFVQRRLQRFRKDCLQRGWRHADDLALGTLFIGD